MAGHMFKHVFKLFGPGQESPEKPPEYFLALCEQVVGRVKDLVKNEKLLNQRQCSDLSSKLSQTIQNIRQLVLHCRGSADQIFRPAQMENLYRYLEKAHALVRACSEEQWWVAAVFQSRNENAFRDILLDISLCYNTIYEQAKSMSREWNLEQLEDLRKSPVLLPATVDDVHKDQRDLQHSLEELAIDPNCVKLLGHSLPKEASLRVQSLARYLLVYMHYVSEQQATALETKSAIFWSKETEPPGTWGGSQYLGSGMTGGGVCRTEWLGIQCAKKEFHDKEFERFFLQEAGIMAHLKHPCIIDFICCSNGEAKGDCFIAMELMEKSLAQLIEEQKDVSFSTPVVVDIIGQIARGMLYLHEIGVAHRDLKPHNVVVKRLTNPHIQNYFSVKLVDFGTSKTIVQVSKSNTMTRVGVGTKVYRAPEVYPIASRNSSHKGRAIWFKADVFSFAITCVHVWSLQQPFQDMAANILHNELMNGRRPWNLLERCPQELCVLLNDCWNTIPRNRPSFMDICSRLEAFRHKLLTGLPAKNMEFGNHLDFIKTRIKEQSSFQKVFFYSTDHEMKDENNTNHIVSIMPCACGKVLKLLPQPPYKKASDCVCNICREDWEEDSDKMDVYHCETCKFDAHPDCVEIKDQVEVFFHDHTLQLLLQNYYNDNTVVKCHFCEESMQESEWVYRCEQCDFDVHALCTKYPKRMMREETHEKHPLTLIQCPPHMNIACTCCNGRVRRCSWRYTCTQKACAFDLHPLCTTLAWGPPCIFDNSHWLSLKRVQKDFHCRRCNVPGFSWFYHCDDCNVDIHLDCIDDIDEEKLYWYRAYEKFMIENGGKDNHTKVNTISELLDKVPFSNTLEASSLSSSRQPPVNTRVESSIQRHTLTERTDVNLQRQIPADLVEWIKAKKTAAKKGNLQRQIAADFVEWIKAKKMAAKEARQKLRVHSQEMLENLERIVLDLRSSESMSQADAVVLAATHEKLKKRQYLVKEQTVMQMQSKRSQGPQIGVFFTNMLNRVEDKIFPIRELLTSLRGDMKGVCFALLCEEPGQEHIVDGKVRMINQELGEERAEKLQPLLVSGLQVVTRVMSALQPHDPLHDQLIGNLGSVMIRSQIPCLEGALRARWDLRAIDLEKHGKGNVEVLKWADSAAEWFRSELENRGVSILKGVGLQRVRYKVLEGNPPHYRSGTCAWLCTDHLNSGVKDGTLESYPLKYCNAENDYHLRLPHVNLQE